MNKLLLWILFLSICITSCSTKQQVNRLLFEEHYPSIETSIKVKVFHHKKDSSIILFASNLKHFKLAVNEQKQVFKNQLKLFYKFTNRKTFTVDSITIPLQINSINSGKILSGELPISLRLGNSGKASLQLLDYQNNILQETTIKINKSFSNQQFTVLKKEGNNNYQLFNNYDDESYSFQNPLGNSNTTFFYNRTKKLATPPFVESFTALANIDSVDFISTNESIRNSFKMKSDHFIVLGDSSSSSFFYSENTSFPYLTKKQFIWKPLRYITTNKEFEAIQASKTPYKEATYFWSKIAGDPDRASHLAKNYYQRIEFSNFHFSAGKEGWTSDRGITYILFGSPKEIIQKQDIEVWLYGEEKNHNNVRFKFIRQFDGDFYFERDRSLKLLWFRRVELWRKGIL